jgi:hypothetical protein
MSASQDLSSSMQMRPRTDLRSDPISEAHSAHSPPPIQAPTSTASPGIAQNRPTATTPPGQPQSGTSNYLHTDYSLLFLHEARIRTLSESVTAGRQLTATFCSSGRPIMASSERRTPTATATRQQLSA